MVTILSGVGLLLVTLAVFSIFSLKMPKGSLAMGGMADAAVATFLVEAIHKYISGDLIGIAFLREVGDISGSMGGVAAATLVPIAMGANPIIEKKLPVGINIIAGALVIAPVARIIVTVVDPGVTWILSHIGATISAATDQSPIVMGFLLGGMMKMICTSPLSSMALTAMLGLTGLPMGIAAIACFGGSFTNGLVFHKLKLGNKGNVIGVMLEPLTQAPIVTSNPIPIYGSNFFGGGFAGISAAVFHIVNDAPGTASPIPGLLAPFAFNPVQNVLLALLFAAIGGSVAGLVGGTIFKHIRMKNGTYEKASEAAEEMAEAELEPGM